MKLDAAHVRRTADAASFDAVQLEKVIRLRQLLIEFRKHPFLRERSVFKGGSIPCTCGVLHFGLFMVFLRFVFSYNQ